MIDCSVFMLKVNGVIGVVVATSTGGGIILVTLQLAV